ncbi:MAG: hypothetical protein VX464_09405 [Pseudomonadota bacterium]|nr:hypothetical protein [Pseudomonadota bacterium]
MSKLRALCATAVVAAVSLSGCQTNNGGSSPTADEERPRFFFNAEKPAGAQIVDLNACYDQRDDAESANAGYAAAGFLLGGIVGAIAVSSAREDSIETALSSCLANRGYEAVLVPENLDWIAFGLETEDGRAESVQAFNQALSDTERDAWQAAVSQSTIVGYRAFVEAHPNGLLTQEAIFRHNRLVKFAQAQYEDAVWAGTATEPGPAVAPLTQNGTSSTSQVAAAPADASNTWRGTAVGQPIGMFENEFCDEARSNRLVLRMGDGVFTGELIRAMDGQTSKIEGKISGETLTGKLFDAVEPNDPFTLTGRIDGQNITGQIYKTNVNDCSATFSVRSSAPNQAATAALQQLVVVTPSHESMPPAETAMAPTQQTGPASVSGPTVWQGKAVPNSVIKNYGEFCDVREASALTFTIDGPDVTGQLVRAADGKIAKLHGTLKGDVLTGQLADSNGFMSKFVFTARRRGNAISGTFSGAAWNGCGADFIVTTDDPRYATGGPTLVSQTQSADGASQKWRGTVVGDGSRVEYGWLFCKDTAPQVITMRTDAVSFRGEVRRNRDGVSIPFEGTIFANKIEGKYKGPDSEINLNVTGTLDGETIKGRLFSSALPACSATFELHSL